MNPALRLDIDAVARVCSAHGVKRLRLFGSATSDRFDAVRSDIDLLVEFTSGFADPFDTYFGLKEELETLFGKGVDLVMADAVRNPYFAASALANTEVLYAA